jgi:uncharacterized protein
LHGNSEKKETLPPVLPPDEPTIITELKLKSLPRNKIFHFLYNIATDSLGTPIYVPILIARGIKKGPFFCITSALHGNEINGVKLIHELMNSVDTNILIGTVICLPISNPAGYFRKKGTYSDGRDLNTIFPGKEFGSPSELFVHRFFNGIIKQMEYLIDIQTAKCNKKMKLNFKLALSILYVFLQT